MGLACVENLIDATQNLDMFVEASGMLRALACNLLKISNDSATPLLRPGRGTR